MPIDVCCCCFFYNCQTIWGIKKLTLIISDSCWTLSFKLVRR